MDKNQDNENSHDHPSEYVSIEVDMDIDNESFIERTNSELKDVYLGSEMNLSSIENFKIDNYDIVYL